MHLSKSKSSRRSGKWPAIAFALSLGIYATGWAQQTPPDHSSHIHPTTTPSDASLSDQVAELRTKVSMLETALQQKHPAMATDPAKPAMGGMAGMPAASPSAGATMPGMAAGSPAGGAAMPGMAPSAPPAGMAMEGMDKMKGMGMGGMSGGGMSGQKGGMPDMMHNMGAMMQEMGGMMQNMQGMEGMGMGGMPMGKPAPMTAMNASSQAQTGGMKAMEPGMMMMESMMGMPAAPAMANSAALPGFPGSSHLYHVGASDFFLNHDQHIALTTEQRAALGRIKENTLMEKSTAERKVAQAEQELWQLTASDQPDSAKIEAKIHEVEQLRGNERLTFIRAIGEAAKVLTDQQRQALLGMQAPQTQPLAAGQHTHPTN